MIDMANTNNVQKKIEQEKLSSNKDYVPRLQNSKNEFKNHKFVLPPPSIKSCSNFIGGLAILSRKSRTQTHGKQISSIHYSGRAKWIFRYQITASVRDIESRILLRFPNMDRQTLRKGTGTKPHRSNSNEA